MATAAESIAAAERQLVTFRLGEDEFGADIMDVREIIRVPEITKVPNAPTYVDGACNLRGNVLPIVDGRERFNLPRKENDENSRVLVVDVDGKATGMVVDRVSEVMRVHGAEIEAPPGIVKNTGTDFLDGVVKLDGGNRLVMLMDVVAALRPENASEPEDAAPAGEELAKTVEAEKEERTARVEAEEQLVSFLLGGDEYAVDIRKVREIIRVPNVVKVPGCEAYIEGVVSIRNSLLPIINLRAYFGMERSEVGDRSRVLVTDMGGFAAGLLVDKVSEVLGIPAGIIQPPPKFSGAEDGRLRGIAKLNDGNRMILLLEPSELVSAEELRAIESGAAAEAKDGQTAEEVLRITEEEQLVTFKIGAEEYGIKITEVQEINRMTEVTKVPRAPRYVEGIVNLRGNVIPALDLRKFFGFEEKAATDSTRIIIADYDGKRTGIIVDSVSEVLRFEKSLIEPPPEILSSGIDAEYVEGVAKLAGGKRMILILDIGKILQTG